MEQGCNEELKVKDASSRWCTWLRGRVNAHYQGENSDFHKHVHPDPDGNVW